MSELLDNYILADGEIISFDLILDHQFSGDSLTRQATVELAVRKRLTATKWQPCRVRLQFQQLRRINIFDDFSSARYSDIIAKCLEDKTWYLSLDPCGNTGEPHERDNMVIVAERLTITEIC